MDRIVHSEYEERTLTGLLLIFAENERQIQELSGLFKDCTLLFVIRGEEFAVLHDDTICMNHVKKTII